MTYRIFGAIDVGSYEVNLKIYELSMKNGIRLLNHVRHRMELGRDTYATGKISTELTDELCAVLLDFKQMMKELEKNMKKGDTNTVTVAVASAE